MQTMKYRGYEGEVVKDNDMYYGHIKGIDNLFYYEGENTDVLYACFKKAVDDYIKLRIEFSNWD